MRRTKDKLSEKILSIITKANEPLETSEVELFLKDIKDATRVKILYRLNNLRGESLIKGKQVGSGKGTWIWWNHETK